MNCCLRFLGLISKDDDLTKDLIDNEIISQPMEREVSNGEIVSPIIEEEDNASSISESTYDEYENDLFEDVEGDEDNEGETSNISQAETLVRYILN